MFENKTYQSKGVINLDFRDYMENNVTVEDSKLVQGSILEGID